MFHMSKRFVRLSELTSTKGKPGRLPVSPATWWRWVAANEAPSPIKLGPNTTVWCLDQIDEWESKRAAGVQSERVGVDTAPKAVKPEIDRGKGAGRGLPKRAELAAV